jgi:hypothetical protein
MPEIYNFKNERRRGLFEKKKKNPRARAILSIETDSLTVN